MSMSLTIIASIALAGCSMPKTVDTVSRRPVGVRESREVGLEAYMDLVGGEYAGKLKRMAMCESSMNEKAVSKGGRYIGLYQWWPTSWEHFECSGDIWNGHDQVDCTLERLREGRKDMWPVCGYK